MIGTKIPTLDRVAPEEEDGWSTPPEPEEQRPVLAVETRFMIKELYRKGISISEIAHQTGRTANGTQSDPGGLIV
jgi:hypothetical protein